MVVAGGTIAVMQPIQMADTTGVDSIPQSRQNMELMMALYGWIGKDPGILWRKEAWRLNQSPSNRDDYLNKLWQVFGLRSVWW